MKSLQYWSPENFETKITKYELKGRIGSIHNVSATDCTTRCIYRYNELGFRGDSIYKNGFKIMSLGCSITEGIGVDGDKTWPAQFSKLIPDSVDLNFGYAGRSNDFIARCLISHYDIINPDLVLIMYTTTNRREFFTENGDVEPFHVKPWSYFRDHPKGLSIFNSLTELSNYENNFQNWYKNHLLIRYFLEIKKCNWLWNGTFIKSDFYDDRRFDGSFCPFLDMAVDKIHPGQKTLKAYSEKLYSHIKENFPTFLPI